MKLRCLLCAFWLAAVALPHTVAAQNYTFTNIADTTGPFSAFLGLSLNNSGTVSFTAPLDGGGSGVYRSDGVVTTTIADDTGPFTTFLYSDINDAGQVAYRAESMFGPGIFRGDGLSTTTIAYQSELPFVSQEFLEDGQMRMNNAGTVAFFAHGQVGTSTIIDSVFVSSGGNVSFISDPSEYRAAGQQINNLGTVAFNFQLFAGAGRGIRLGNGGTSSLVIDHTGPYSSFGVPGLNDENIVSVAAQHDSGGWYALRIDAGAVDVVAGPYVSAHEVGINNAGEVAFLAELTAGMRRILTGPDSVADKVIANGDALYGSTVTIPQQATTIDGPNESGQIAFHYSLADGRSGIALATPIPELAGDYNANGTVDAADYVLWRKNNNTAVTLPNDATPGTSPADYTVWRSHFGQPPGSGSGASANAAVPEPATFLLLMFGVAGWCLRRRRGRIESPSNSSTRDTGQQPTV